MTAPEITPKQLRALLLLLVLVPFIPMVLMLRFMADALDAERDAAWERMVRTNQSALISASNSVDKHLTELKSVAVADELRRLYREIFDPTVDVVVVDAAGHLGAGTPPLDGKFITQTAHKYRDNVWTVQAWLINETPLRDSIRDQFKVYGWTGLITGVAICSIAAAAGLVVNRQLQLHELKNTAVATVAHELRTPLATMRVLVDTLREGRYRHEDQLREYLDLLHSENLRLSRVTERFLTHARLERGQHPFHFAPTPVRSIVDAAFTAWRGRLDAPGCTFAVDLAEPLPEISADRDSLVTVLTNLLENALKYTGDEKQITVRAQAAGGGVRLSVMDNGVGLSRTERRSIFEPFRQVDQKLSRTREGSGLGLSIVRHIVRAHRGKIEVESRPGFGSTFTVILPAALA